MPSAQDHSVRSLRKNQARQRSNTRKLIKWLLTPVSPPPGGGHAELRSLANTFSRYAQTQQTAYETGVAAASSGTTSVAERTVEHAIAQVLGRTPSSNGVFAAALSDAFPTLPNGQVSRAPVRGIVSMNGVGTPSTAAADGSNLSGQISAEQATLYRQAGLIVPDARKVLASVTPFATVDQPDIIESLRGVIDQAFATLLEEFGRVDEPRSELVNDYLSNAATSVAQLGVIAKVDGRAATPDTYSDEQQIASYKLLKTYLEQLKTAWKEYGGRKADPSSQYPLFTERLARASQLMGVLTQANVNFMSAMDSVGFPEAERRSPSSRFEYLQTGISVAHVGAPKLKALAHGHLMYSTMTVYDYTSWVEKLTRYDGPRYLTDSGQVGLEFVTSQADELFCTIAPVLYFAFTGANQSFITRPIVAQVLSHERVTWAMSDLFSQLDVLADLAA
ncbi:MAG: hypothetical protein WB810_05455 [Candidatus Cybelea sp.]